MSQREFMIILAHTHVCGMCRARLLADPVSALNSRPLTEGERSILGSLQFEHFITPDTLARAAGCTVADLDAFRDEPVVRLRHL